MKRGIVRPALVLVAVAVVGPWSPAGRGDDWPQFRGPNRDNKVTGFKVPEAWPKELKKQWSVSVGDGLASPALVGDKVYTFTRQGGDEVTLCLNAADGKEVWKDKYAADEVRGAAAGFKGPDKFTGPRSSPAVGDGKVCTFGVGGVVSCLDAGSGKVVWRKETRARPMFYTSSSPTIAGDVCIVFVGGNRGELTAFDLANGEPKWKWTGDGAAYGSPVVATLGGVKQVVVLGAEGLDAVALADGKLLWRHTFSQGRYQTGTPVIDGDTVICAGLAVTVTKKDDGFTTKQLWKGQAPHQYNTPVLKDGLLYGLLGAGRDTKIYCQDAKTGEVLWTDSTGRGQCGAILDAGPVLVELSSDSTLVAFKPDKSEFKEVAKYKVADTATWAMPVLAGNRVFVKDRDSVTLWTIE